MIVLVALLVLSGLAAADGVEANARRGAAVFRQQKCTMCHAASETGADTPSKFEPHPGRDYTPAGMASRMWNHAPRMWAAIRQAGLEIPPLTESDAADLFAFFYAAHFFEQRGDDAVGKGVFEHKCAKCHSAAGPGKPVSEWKRPLDSVELVQRLWNHAPEMNRVLKARKRRWPRLSSEELAGLLSYVRSLPGNQSDVQTFSLPTGAGGKALLQSKGCTACHKGFQALEGRLINHTLTEIAGSMWNHDPAMREKTEELSLDQMREILAYIWSTDFFRSRGNVAEGGKIFDSRCGTCHANPGVGAPNLKKINRRYTAITMVWALWNHGPRMLQEVENRQRAWPELSESEMENLIAFLDFRLRIGGY